MKQARELTEQHLAFIDVARVARLTTLDADTRPHAVPICYARIGNALYSPIDEKPKRVEAMQLSRVQNIMQNPNVILLIDRYSEDWNRLGFISIHAAAAVIEPGQRKHLEAVESLRRKYEQYRRMHIERNPLIRLQPLQFVSWGDLSSDSRESLQFDEVIRGRRSVRWYQDREVPKEILLRILDAGRWAPSPHGRQPWRFAVITRPDLKRQLAEAMAETWKAQLRLDGQSEETVNIRLNKSRQRIEGSPVLVVLCLYTEGLDEYPDPDRQFAETTMAVQSLGAAAQNMLLKAYQAGLDGGWMCAPLFCPDVVRVTLGLPEEANPHALLTFGYAAADPTRRTHRDAEELLLMYD